MPIPRALLCVAPLIACLASCSNKAPVTPETLATWQGVTLFDLEAEALDGGMLDLGGLVGRPVLVVNTASRCGLTPQYAELQELHETYGGRGLVVLGFPCNQFLGQEPGTAEEIAAFCEESYGVSFRMMAKVEVKAGQDQHPVYGLLGTRTGQLPNWNFAKYLVSPDGAEVTFFGARTQPLDAELTGAIEAYLAEASRG